MEVRSVGRRLLSTVLSAVLAVSLCFGMLTFANTKAFAADTTNTAVTDAATGVFKFNWSIDGTEYGRGSCFLINEDTILTGYHCTFFSSAELEKYGFSGQSVAELRERMTYSVNVQRDVKVNAKLVNYSEEQDFAILKLDQAINNRTPLTFADSTQVKQTDKVYSIGFPANNDATVIMTYTDKDVTINSGAVTKAETVFQGRTYEGFVVNGYYIQTDVAISGGDSGGPMVDNDGHVIGISLYSESNHYYAAAADVILSILDDLGIQYNSVASASGTSANTSTSTSIDKSKLNTAISEAKALDSSNYTKESYEKVTAALKDAETAANLEVAKDAKDSDKQAAQTQIDEATVALTSAIDGLEVQSSGLPIGAIIAIVAVVIAVIVVVIVLVLRSKKKKAPAVGNANPYQPQPTGQTNNQAQASGAVFTPVPAMTQGASEDAEGTTVLGEDASDTIMLFQAASGGSLVRMSNNEHIPINKAEFTIGRERSKVDYCLEGNSSISRIHVRLVVRDDKTFLIDNKAANGTYVNGVKVRAGEEIALKTGDIVTLADEKFKYSN